MPIYEYECKDCETEFEELVAMGSTESPACPGCGSGRTRKKMSRFGSIGGGGSVGSSCGRSGFS